jgi:hypothetical protein
MTASDRSPRRRTSRAVHPILALAVAAALGIIAIMGVAPKALAGPPPASCASGPCLEVAPDHGRAAASFTASYWFVGRGACPYLTVAFSWDDIPAATIDLDAACSATHTFGKPPSPATVGSHSVTAIACSATGCDGNASAKQLYSIDPTPTLKLSPTKGLAAAAFTATYASGDVRCGSADVQFFWSGKPAGPRVPLDVATCSAVRTFKPVPLPNGVGAHPVTAQTCNVDGCISSTQASATFTVTPTPTPTPTARPTATPSPTPDPSPSPSPSVEPSATPPAPTTPSPGPTGEVLEATSPPEPTPSAILAAPLAPAATPSGNPYVPALATFVGGPAGPIDPAVVGTNLLLTILFVFLFGLTAEIFNSTMDANRDEIHGWWVRLGGGSLRYLRAFTLTGAGASRWTGAGRIGSIARVVAVLGLSGLIYSFLSPDFGLNPQSLVLFISLVIGLGFITYYSEGSASRLAKRRFNAAASINLYGTAVVVAIVAVFLSRALSFQPGLVYGFIASAVIVTPIALAKREDATLILIPAFGLLVVSVLAWLLLGPVRVLAAGGAPLPALGETILAMIVIGGLEGLVVTMIPLRFLDGATVRRWSRLAWALWFGIVVFLWWQLLFNQNAAYAAAFEQTNVQVVLAVLGVFMLTTGGIWSYFRFRPAPAEAEA